MAVRMECLCVKKELEGAQCIQNCVWWGQWEGQCGGRVSQWLVHPQITHHRQLGGSVCAGECGVCAFMTCAPRGVKGGQKELGNGKCVRGKMP